MSTAAGFFLDENRVKSVMILPISLAAVTKVERHAATSYVIAALNTLGGWVDDTQFFSNKMVTFRFVLPQGQIAAFVINLGQNQIHVDQANPDVVKNAADEQAGSLQLTFIHNEPDLIIPIPAIPG